VGAGDLADNTTFPMFDAVNNTATRALLSLAPGTDNVTCAPEWVRADGTRAREGEVVTLGVMFVVTAGPVLAADIGHNYPGTAVDTFAGAGPPTSTVSLVAALPPGSSGTVPRYVRCLVTGRALGSATGLPVYASAAAYVLPSAGNGTRLVDADGAHMVDCGGGAVIDTNRDAANCGTCGTVCPPGSTCQLGTCVCSRVVTSDDALTATTARNVSVVLVGGGGGAGGLLSADDMAAGVDKANAGYGGGGGSSAVVIGGALALAAAGGAGGVGGYGPRYNASDAVGQPGQIVRALLPVPGGATIRIVVGGGGGGGGGGRYSGPLAHAEVSVGGGGGAGWFGGGGGFAGNATMQASSPYFAGYRAGGGTGTTGGAGFSAGVQGAGGAGQAGSTHTGPSQQAAGGTLAAGGVGVRLESVCQKDINEVWSCWRRGGGGGGGAAGGGGGAGGGFSDDFLDNLHGSVANGGGPGADGDQGSSGAATWAGGIKVGAGAGGTPQLSPDDQNIVITQGGGAGLAVLRWEAMGGVCAF
jgi:hypothetical protein